MKLIQLRLAWKIMYGVEENFPSDVILFKDISKIKLVPPAQRMKTPTQRLPPTLHLNQQANTRHQDNRGVYDTKSHGLYNKSKEDVITEIQHALYKRYQQFVATLKKYMTYQLCHLYSDHTKLMTASFDTAHPQVVSSTLQLCIALARYALLYSVQLAANL